MVVVGSIPQHLNKCRVVDPHCISRGGLDIYHQITGASVKRGDSGSEFFRLGKIDRPGSLVRVPEARPVSKQLTLLASGKERKAGRASRTLEREKSVAINAGIADEDFFQLFATHAFHRITPKAVDGSDGGH